MTRRVEYRNALEPGQFMPDGTVYLGYYMPKDREGNSLGKIFNVFAAPEDLPGTMKYVDAVDRIAGLKKWHGFDGTNYLSDKEIFAALKDGSYNGGWIIPTRELLMGTGPDGRTGIRTGTVIQPDNLFDHQNKGAFKGTFNTVAVSGSDRPLWYWSSTQHRDHPTCVWDVRFLDGYESWHCTFGGPVSCRLVRLVDVAAEAASTAADMAFEAYLKVGLPSMKAVRVAPLQLKHKKVS